MYIYLNNWQQWLTFILTHLVPCFLLGIGIDRVIIGKLTPKKIFEIIKTKIEEKIEMRKMIMLDRVAWMVKNNPEYLEEFERVLNQNKES